MSRNPFLEMLTAPEQEIPGTFWATVTATNPLRVKRDTEPVLPVTPQTLANLAVGDRVLCLWERRQVIVLGRMGGPEPNTIVINGTAYQATGTIEAPDYSWSGTSNGISHGTISVPAPYQRPSGWSFQWSVGHSNRTTFVENASRYPDSNGIQQVRIIQIGNSDLGQLTRLRWQLVIA